MRFYEMRRVGGAPVNIEPGTVLNIVPGWMKKEKIIISSEYDQDTQTATYVQHPGFETALYRKGQIRIYLQPPEYVALGRPDQLYVDRIQKEQFYNMLRSGMIRSDVIIADAEEIPMAYPACDNLPISRMLDRGLIPEQIADASKGKGEYARSYRAYKGHLTRRKRIVKEFEKRIQADRWEPIIQREVKRHYGRR